MVVTVIIIEEVAAMGLRCTALRRKYYRLSFYYNNEFANSFCRTR
jgi:hypothetical protein